tara:strand:+ start:4316 stop:5155 length:840 start_codon:yes stop_codon:yes gene_type:complete
MSQKVKQENKINAITVKSQDERLVARAVNRFAVEVPGIKQKADAILITQDSKDILENVKARVRPTTKDGKNVYFKTRQIVGVYDEKGKVISSEYTDNLIQDVVAEAKSKYGDTASVITKTTKGYFTEEGDLVEKSQIQWTEHLEDGDREVQPFLRTKVIKIIEERDFAELCKFVPDRVYEVGAKEAIDEVKHNKIIDYCVRGNKVLIGKVRWGGSFKEYYIVFYPVSEMIDGEKMFTLCAMITQKKLNFAKIRELDLEIPESPDENTGAEISTDTLGAI